MISISVGKCSLFVFPFSRFGNSVGSISDKSQNKLFLVLAAVNLVKPCGLHRLVMLDVIFEVPSLYILNSFKYHLLISQNSSGILLLSVIPCFFLKLMFVKF